MPWSALLVPPDNSAETRGRVEQLMSGLPWRWATWDRITESVPVAAVRYSTLPPESHLALLCEALTALNVDYLLRRPTEPLYFHDLTYSEESGRPWEHWLTVPWAIRAKRDDRLPTDCKTLSAWRAAELRVSGVPARCVGGVVGQRSNTLVYHVTVEWLGVREDPSATLGG